MIDTAEKLAHVSLRLLGYRSRRVKTSVGRVQVIDGKGEGTLPPIVLLHGFSAAGIHYATLVRFLKPHVRRLVIPDFPAHGLSDAPRPISTRGLTSGLFEALDEVLDGEEPAILFGNSMGGHAAALYARTRPEKVAGVLLCSPGGAAMTQEELARFLDEFDVRSYRQALAFVDRLFTRGTLLRPLVAWGVRRKFGHPNMRALIASYSPSDLLRKDDLHGIQAPMLILWGREDRILPRGHLDFFRQCLPPQARLEEPERFSHSPYLDEPREVARRLLAFAAEVDGARRRHAAAAVSGARAGRAG